jgi:hypothetical protein
MSEGPICARFFICSLETIKARQQQLKPVAVEVPDRAWRDAGDATHGPTQVLLAPVAGRERGNRHLLLCRHEPPDRTLESI